MPPELWIAFRLHEYGASALYGTRAVPLSTLARSTALYRLYSVIAQYRSTLGLSQRGQLVKLMIAHQEDKIDAESFALINALINDGYL